ncbi:MAG: DEAD/DEAH box helicase [Bacteroidetes bacterium]|nr:DEAD/DEAH box helicase [Bacteroidota bacterium]
MIPAIVGREVRATIEDFLRTRYRISTPSLARAIDDFIERGEAFKGTYLSFQLPFKKGTSNGERFPEIPLGFPPYLHQERAFERLSANPPKPTIVATGTGSGKTEAFLYPILDYCRQVAGQSGIKAILIYPMNALATDQAKRIAHIIYENPSLRDKITAGLYIGGKGATSRRQMTKSGIISSRYALRESPPDLLLTNYKMLDYLMIRPTDTDLWRGNHPGTLRYVVVDELHTFDGAQGTDLACLLRRLKARLRATDLCPVGTSATLGSDSSDELRTYAQTIFDAKFDDEAIITEARLEPGEFLMDSLIRRFNFPGHEELVPSDQFESIEAYIGAQYKAWFDSDTPSSAITSDEWRAQLGEQLRQHAAFQNLIKIVGDKTLPSDVVAEQLAAAGGREALTKSENMRVFESLLALVSYARDPKNAIRPLLDVRIQFWMRELARMVASIEKQPQLTWSTDLADEQQTKYAPLASCIKCGNAGWLATQKIISETPNLKLQLIYDAYFGKRSDLKVIYPDATPSPLEIGSKLCVKCLSIYPEQTPECDECTEEDTLIKVYLHSFKDNSRRSGIQLECPYCNESNQPGIFGSRAASLLSIALGQTFASRYNEDKKVLTFSDSVQDAAHRAGFFAARTYSFSVRTALLKHLKTLDNDQGIKTVAEGLVQSQCTQLGDASFVGTFIAPNMFWLDDYEALRKRGELPKGSDLPDKVAKRLEWEVYLHFGVRARRGRTLENTLSAAISVDQDLFTSWIQDILPDLKANYEGLREIDERTFRQCLTGLIYRLRTDGGVVHPRLTKYIESLGRDLRSISDQAIPWMPRFKYKGPYPRFLTTASTQNFLPLTGSKSSSWVQGWTHKCLLPDGMIVAGLDAALREVLLSAPSDLLRRFASNRHLVWGLDPDALTVTTDVCRFTCYTCHYDVSVPVRSKDIWHKMPCINHRCTGRFELQDNYQVDYYKALYGSGDVCRFVPKEHTALLTAKQRERIEKDFMREDRRPWDPNIVSCTPTLELGIDIGDLSTVFLGSVPPAQANYVQRVGRAGRQNGNSVAFTVANSRAHDLYFFADPDEIISGKVQVPGTFLKAPEMLQRQMAAYSMDMWVAQVKGANVPRNLNSVLSSLKRQDPKAFPFNWLAYVDAHVAELTEGFQKLFQRPTGIGLTESVLQFLYPETTSGPNLRQVVLRALQERYDSKRDLKNRLDRLARRIKEFEDTPRDDNYDEQRKNFQYERAALTRMRRAIGQVNVFNFLSDAGILPNYAFPQSGTELSSTIFLSQDKEGTVPTVETFERPGYQAIRELAPGNFFYANERKVEISGVQFDKGAVQTWRFCPDCSWYALESTVEKEVAKKCPKCNCDAWGDLGQTRRLVKLRKVRSNSHERKSRIDDRREERQRTPFVVHTHVKFNQKDVTVAYQSKEASVPFGFEFIERASFAIINHGHRSPDAPPMEIAGKEESIGGFTICITCGKTRLPQQASDHEFYCRHRGEDTDKHVSLSLYHDFESESIRILLPITEQEGDWTHSESFCAALSMGLKKYFHGQVDHLETVVQDAPIPNEEIRCTFVYLYDTVPGGTGYLKDLLTDETIIDEVLSPALKHLQECDCKNDDSKDGCYRCLLAYRNSFTRYKISRQAAINILEEIVDRGGGLEEVDSIDDITTNPLIESKLEERFIQSLRRRMKRGFVEQYSGVEKFYQFTLGKRTWTVDCQALLDETKGVTVPSKPDFLLTPDKQAGCLPIAVFTDGFTYHRDQLADDTLKRMAILASGRYHVWSLTWDDLNDSNKRGNEKEDFFPLDSRRRFANHFKKLINSFEPKLGKLGTQIGVSTAGSFEILKAYLTDPDLEKWQALAHCHGAINTKEPGGLKNIDQYAPDWFIEKWFAEPGPQAGAFWVRSADNLHEGCVATSYPSSKTNGPLTPSILVYLDDRACSEPSFKPFWNEFLRAMNLFQFLHPQTGFFCKSGLDDDEHYAPLDTEIIGSTMPVEWREVLSECAEESYLPILGRLADKEAPAPEVGFEITDTRNQIMTTAEIAWPSKKMALLYGECWDDHLDCTNQGWKCLNLNELSLDDVTTILELLGI